MVKSSRCINMFLLLLGVHIHITTAFRILNYNTTLVVPGFNSCNFDGQKHKIGDTFHPLVKVNGKNMEQICRICTCNPTTKVQCEKIECPKLDCRNPIQINGTCCEVCPGENESGIVLEEKAKYKDCVFSGTVYRHGNTFHAPSSVNSTDFTFCTLYTCYNGTLTYKNVSDSCPPLACNSSLAFHVEGYCCKVCPEVKLENGECVDERGMRRGQNETWKFYLHTTREVLDCIDCQCKKDGSKSFTCSKRPCPPVRPCTDKDKIEEIVACCPKCQRHGTSRHINSTTPIEEPSTNTTISSEPPTLTIVPCKQDSHRVYLCNDSSMAIENVQNENVTVYVWLEAGLKHTYFYTSAEFSGTTCKSNFRGMTMERRVNGLENKQTKREKIESCRKDCAHLVVRMLRPEQECL